MCYDNNKRKYTVMFTHLKEYEKMLRKGVCIIPTVQLSPVRMGPLGKQTPSSA
jgi:hypothetical protein